MCVFQVVQRFAHRIMHLPSSNIYSVFCWCMAIGTITVRPIWFNILSTKMWHVSRANCCLPFSTVFPLYQCLMISAWCCTTSYTPACPFFSLGCLNKTSKVTSYWLTPLTIGKSVKTVCCHHGRACCGSWKHCGQPVLSSLHSTVCSWLVAVKLLLLIWGWPRLASLFINVLWWLWTSVYWYKPDSGTSSWRSLFHNLCWFCCASA